jgi:hypothetical protein
VSAVSAHEPVTVSCWRSAGAIHILLGNLESGWMGDARFPRRVTLSLPLARLELDPGTDLVCAPLNIEGPSIAPDADSTLEVVRFTLTVEPAACLVLRVEPAGAVA